MICWKSKACRQFDGWSASYDRSVLQRLFFRPSHDALIRSLPALPNQRLLDVGCGTGNFLRRWLEHCPNGRAVGIDLSPKMLALAEKNLAPFRDRVELVLGDAEHLPFADESFDAITCVHSFHHYPHQSAVVAEMRRTLRDQGDLYIVDGDRDGWWGWLVFDGVVTTIEGLVHHCSANQMRDILRSANFRDVVFERNGLLAPFLVTHGCGLRQAREAKAPQKAAA